MEAIYTLLDKHKANGCSYEQKTHFYCNKCEKVFESESLLISHTKEHRAQSAAVEQQKRVCQFCQKSFKKTFWGYSKMI